MMLTLGLASQEITTTDYRCQLNFQTIFDEKKKFLNNAI